jgi:hypothetical protein
VTPGIRPYARCQGSSEWHYFPVHTAQPLQNKKSRRLILHERESPWNFNLDRPTGLSAQTIIDGFIQITQLTYSTELAKLPWGAALHQHEHLLPSSIRPHTRLICWKAAPKLGRSFIPYRYGATPAASGGASVPSVVDHLSESGT